MADTGSLSIVATPIGNPADITLRALEVLRSADMVICEETRQGSSILKRLGIIGKELIELNEHNEQEKTPDILQLLYQNKNLALISDCGTPVFSDPGAYLISQAVEVGIPIIPIPGVSSLMATLSILDFKLDRFIFAGFLPRESELRLKELTRIKALRMPVILMDTPYRLAKLLDEVGQAFGKGQAITLACDLTLPTEKIYRGDIALVRSQVNQKKAEFILIIHG
jgi:16S rRNA (cytidine1402-2'-O)-methyltransferase